MRKFLTLLVVSAALTFGGVGVASAHTSLTCVNAFGSVITTTANVCPGGTIPVATGLRCVQPDGEVIETTANTCPFGDVPLASDGLAFGGSLGARFFPAGFDFGSLSDQRVAQDANACAAAIAFIETQHLGPQHRAAAIGLLSQLTVCQNNTGINSQSGPVCNSVACFFGRSLRKR